MKKAYEVIEDYLSNILKPQLTAFGATDDMIEYIASTVREWMLSCVFHWNDVSFRRAILVGGEEEGTYYQPKEHLDIRSFVVITVRNSAIESIHSDSYQPAGLCKQLTSEDIKTVTASAIKYFMNVDFTAIANQMDSPESDLYDRLSKKYPVSWSALTALANSKKQVISYEPIPIKTKSDLSILKTRHAVHGLFFEEDRSQMMQVTSDGYSLTIDHGLLHTLQTVTENKLPFVSDSFKGISRNIEKLLAIMEYIMGNELAVITSNYLIANGYIERRLKPVKPGHDLNDIKLNWLNSTGLTERHKSWLTAAAEM